MWLREPVLVLFPEAKLTNRAELLKKYAMVQVTDLQVFTGTVVFRCALPDKKVSDFDTRAFRVFAFLFRESVYFHSMLKDRNGKDR